MRKAWFLLLTLAATLPGCGTAPQQLALPAVAPSKARLIFYRSGGNPYDGLDWAVVSLNGKRTGASAPGTVFYRDLAPGTYQIEITSDKLYPDQFKTVQVEGGSTTFVKVVGLPYWGQSGLQWWGSTFMVAIIDPAVGEREIGPLQLTSG